MPYNSVNKVWRSLLRVLITGITGFAGSHMMDYLLAEQPEVEIFGIYRRRSRLEHLAHVSDKLHMIEPGVASIANTRESA